MKIDISDPYSPCFNCIVHGHLYSSDDSRCQNCEYNIAILILKEVLKQNDYCGLCRHVEHIKGGYTECTFGHNGWQECGEDYGIDWNAIVEEYGINTEKVGDCYQG